MKKFKILILNGRAYAQVGIAFMSVYSPSQQVFHTNDVVNCVPMHGSSGPYLRVIEDELIDTETDTVDEVVTKTSKRA